MVGRRGIDRRNVQSCYWPFQWLGIPFRGIAQGFECGLVVIVARGTHNLS